MPETTQPETPNPFPPRAGLRLVAALGRVLLRLRYRIEVRGLDAIRARGRARVLFLANHAALIDPVILITLLYPDFSPRSLADEWQIGRPLLGPFARAFGARALPNLERRGAGDRDSTREAFRETIEGLRRGESLLVYPAGHLKRSRYEEIGARSGAETLLREVPELRVVLVRHDGLWGSRFSMGYDGRMPRFVPVLLRGLRDLLLNGVFFMPRRRVSVEFVERDDLPRQGGRLELNRALEAFYNETASPNTWVPYGFWQGGPQERPDPEPPALPGEPAAASASTRALVLEHLSEQTGKAAAADTDRLGADLGLDSLAVAELIEWLEREFGHSVGTPESLRTVGDVILAASGQGVSARQMDLPPPSPRWFERHGDEVLAAPAGKTIPEVFLAQASAGPARVIVADPIAGERTYRDLVTAVMLLKPVLEKIDGPYVGVMLPASVGAAAVYLACLFAGKTPVMVNWTTGSRFLRHSLDHLQVRRVVTARAMVKRLRSLGTDLSGIEERFLYAEDLREGLSLPRKLAAAARSRLSWGDLRRARPREEALILFTSGSESLPKAVPLTHANVLANVRDIPSMLAVRESDILLGMLPPFHSFGIVVTTVFPLCVGLRTVFHTNPTEGAILARIIETYRVTTVAGTPTFLAGILRSTHDGQLASLRVAVTGAEKCPRELLDSLARRYPGLTVLEGYGITECSPVVSATSERDPVRGSIGRLLPSVEGVLLDEETGARAAPGKAGVLLLRGPSIFNGYLNYDGRPPFVTFEGKSWYRTGDLVRQAPDGNLYFEGRLSRFVKIGGEMISLPAIESVLEPHFRTGPDEGPVMAVDAAGPPERPEVVLYTARPAERDRVNGWLREAGLSPLHNVRQIVHVDTIPVLGTGKTDYRTLRAQAQAQVQSEAEGHPPGRTPA